MKKLLFTPVLVFILVTTGCQENTLITEPFSTLSKPSNPAIQERIEICCQVCDPWTGICRVNGFVDYSHQIISGPESDSGLYTILLNLNINVDLCSKCMFVHPEWIVKGTSEDVVTVSEEGILQLDKSYIISNRNDIILCVQYLITTEGVGISNVWLQEVDNP